MMELKLTLDEGGMIAALISTTLQNPNLKEETKVKLTEILNKIIQAI